MNRKQVRLHWKMKSNWNQNQQPSTFFCPLCSWRRSSKVFILFKYWEINWINKINAIFKRWSFTYSVSFTIHIFGKLIDSRYFYYRYRHFCHNDLECDLSNDGNVPCSPLEQLPHLKKTYIPSLLFVTLEKMWKVAIYDVFKKNSNFCSYV